MRPGSGGSKSAEGGILRESETIARVKSVPARRLAAVYFGYFAFVGAYSPYLGLYLQSIGMSAAAIGLLLAEMQLVRIFAPNAWAWLADRTGTRVRVLQLALLAAALTFCGFFGTVSFAGLALVMAVHAFCSGGVTPLIESTTLAALSSTGMARYGAIRLWGSVGFIVAVLGVGAQLDWLPIASLLWTVFAVIALTFCTSLALPQTAPATRRASESILAIAMRREVLALFAACFLMTVAHGPLYAFFSIYLADHGYAKTTIGVLWALGVLAEIAVFWYLPQWSKRFSMERVLAASFGCAVVRFVMIGWGVDSVAIVVLAQLLHAATFGSYHVAAIALVQRAFAGGRETGGQALYTSVSYGAGGMLGAAGAGWLWESAGPAWTMTVASLCAAAGWMVLRSGRRALSVTQTKERSA